MEGTRLKILQILQKNSQETVEGLANAIGLAPATIRRHLDILQRDRLVGFEEVRKRTGRPEYSFFLTEDGQESLPKDYDKLLNLVVEELASLTSEEIQGRNGSDLLHFVFQRLSGQMEDELESQIVGMDTGQRVAALVKVLKDQDFSPSIELEDGSLSIKLMNCPFRSVALKNKSICSYDFHLISAMLNADVKKAESIQDGSPRCVYKAMITPEQLKELPSVIGD